MSTQYRRALNSGPDQRKTPRQRWLAEPPKVALWLGLTLAAAVFAAVTLFVGPGDIRPPRLPAELADQPNAYLENGTITQFRGDGSLHYRLQAERATYFDVDNLARLTRPALELHIRAAPPWHIESAFGEVRTVVAPGGGREERADLRGDVRLVRDDANGERTELRTEALSLYPERELARGDQDVMISRGTGGRVVAAGFEADLTSGRIALFSQADQRVSIVVLPSQFN